MGITYTPNIGLAMQEDKTDTLDWDALTENWRKIDSALSTPLGHLSVNVNGFAGGEAGHSVQNGG